MSGLEVKTSFALYGVLPNVKLHLIAPAAYDSPSVGSRHYGYGDIPCYFVY